MKIRVIAESLGEHAKGAVLDYPEHRAKRVIHMGYAEAVDEGAKDGDSRADRHADHGSRRARRQ